MGFLKLKSLRSTDVMKGHLIQCIPSGLVLVGRLHSNLTCPITSTSSSILVSSIMIKPENAERIILIIIKDVCNKLAFPGFIQNVSDSDMGTDSRLS